MFDLARVGRTRGYIFLLYYEEYELVTLMNLNRLKNMIKKIQELFNADSITKHG